MRILVTLRFIRAEANGNRQFGFVLLRDPYLVLAEHYVAGRFENSEGKQLWRAIQTRCIDIGVNLQEYLDRIPVPFEEKESALAASVTPIEPQS